MYLPKEPRAKQENPFRIHKSQRFLLSAAVVAGLTTVASIILALQKTQARLRHTEETIDARRRGKRVVIVGGGAAGCALAGNLTTSSETVNVTVFEAERKQTFYAMVPHAHVGHRSYDLNTTGGVDFLRSPATWNVTRDAKLVPKEVVRIFPERNTLVDEDGTCHEYDYLVVAAGGQRTLGHLAPFFQSLRRPAAGGSQRCSVWKSWLTWETPSAPLASAPSPPAAGRSGSVDYEMFVDRHGIAVNPGVMRDSLIQTYRGNIIHIKVPPKSFVDSLESPVVSEFMRSGGLLSDPSEPGHGDATLVDARRRVARRFMTYFERQHDSTFISSMNIIWKYLDYFNKRQRCNYIAVTADSTVSDALPISVGSVIDQHLNQRKVNLLTNTYVVSLDPIAKQVGLRNYTTAEEQKLDYSVLLLDLPLSAPGFISASGLDGRITGAERQRRLADALQECGVAMAAPLTRPGDDSETFAVDTQGFVDVDAETLQHRRFRNIFALGDCAALPTAKSYGAAFAQVPVVSHNIRALIANDERRERTQQHLEASTSQESTPPQPACVRAVNAKYDGYTSFNVIMTTWRAMWPEMSYCANQRKVFAMTRAKLAQERAQEEERTAEQRARGFMGRIAGSVTPWKRWNSAPAAPLAASHLTDLAGCKESDVDETAWGRLRRVTSAYAVVEPLRMENHHLYDNCAWRDVRGFLNGLFIQTAMYEVLFWFYFMRGAWYPPLWFHVPTFDIADGRRNQPTVFGL